jgi:hypothetical protein
MSVHMQCCHLAAHTRTRSQLIVAGVALIVVGFWGGRVGVGWVIVCVNTDRTDKEFAKHILALK